MYQYDFPDTAEFGTSLLDNTAATNESKEKYCQLVLLLFSSYRSIFDLKGCNETGLHHFKHLVPKKHINDKNLWFLQNLQDAKSNCLCLKSTSDPLQHQTEQFLPADVAFDLEKDSKEDNQHELVLQDELLDHLLQEMTSDLQQNNKNDTCNDVIPDVFSARKIRQKGSHLCGYEHLANMRLTNDKGQQINQSCIYQTLSDDSSINFNEQIDT